LDGLPVDPLEFTLAGLVLTTVLLFHAGCYLGRVPVLALRLVKRFVDDKLLPMYVCLSRVKLGFLVVLPLTVGGERGLSGRPMFFFLSMITLVLSMPLALAEGLRMTPQALVL
jgi:hypothetical protein